MDDSTITAAVFIVVGGAFMAGWYHFLSWVEVNDPDNVDAINNAPPEQWLGDRRGQ